MSLDFKMVCLYKDYRVIEFYYINISSCTKLDRNNFKIKYQRANLAVKISKVLKVKNGVYKVRNSVILRI